MYYFYPTPEHVVDNIIKKHAPRKFISLLDPSIGDGALINGVNTSDKEITCVDIDICRLNQSRQTLRCSKLNLLHGDFLEIDFADRRYDFIVCNPPFDGRNHVLAGNKKIPIEASFLLKSMKLCSENGRMIFILPSSVTRGSRLKWFRELVLNEFNLSYSYKLPSYTFNKVEGDFSVLVFDKKNIKTRTILRSENAELIVKDVGKFSKTFSFDAKELISLNNYRKLIGFEKLQVIPLANLIDIQRGNVKSNYKQEGVLHTTNIHIKHVSSKMKNEKITVTKGDWVIKRVSRDLASSLKEYIGCDILFTDCILRLRARKKTQSDEVFFALIVMFQLIDFRTLIIKGSGAKYLDVTAMKEIGLPISLAALFQEEFNIFKNGTENERSEIARRVSFLLKNISMDSLNLNVSSGYEKPNKFSIYV
ncbi:Eco57I restriction-modification methylase domain-containing protein [Shewanella frigidimarina]|uniref:Eco57I restriction-modification methylase domain-containing protein n=1 Tax=Shewanella frigidimarina TaxID=56812 RepID=UPI003D7A9542